MEQRGLEDTEAWCDRTLALLELEQDEEEQERKRLLEGHSLRDLVLLGHVIRNVHVQGMSVGGQTGRCTVTLERIATEEGGAAAPFLQHRVKPGDIVCVCGKGRYMQGQKGSKKKKKGAKKGVNSSSSTSSTSSTSMFDDSARGVVYSVKERSMVIAFKELPEEEVLPRSGALIVMRVADDVTFRRLERAVNYVRKCHVDPGNVPQYAHHMVSTLFNPLRMNATMPKRRVPITPFNETLNSTQIDAVEFALDAPDVALVHGPPGTGKTTTVVEIMLQCILGARSSASKKRRRVLMCAPSNIAVDNIVLKLGPYAKAHGLVVARVGHIARVLREVREHSLEVILANSDGEEIVRDIRKEMMELQRTNMAKLPYAQRRQKYGEMKELRRELRARQKKAIADVLRSCDIILGTNTGVCSKYLNLASFAQDIDGFDMVIIDEAAQALEAACWIPIVLGRKLVLAGDHKQLPPTITSTKAAGVQEDGSKGLEYTLFDRVLEHAPSEERVLRMLTIQYRMHEDIMKWSSDELYGGRLRASDDVRSHLLRDLEHVKDGPFTDHPLVMIDTAHCHMYETMTVETDRPKLASLSKSNPDEGDLVLLVVRQLCDAGLQQEEIAVISPYNAQVDLIARLLEADFGEVEVGTVDGFQGREKEAIVISMVRSNEDGDVGFLAEQRRMNVAVTRARRMVCIVCDSDTVSHDPFLGRMVEYFQEHGDYHGAVEYTDLESKPRVLKATKKKKKGLSAEDDSFEQEFKEIEEALQRFEASDSNELVLTLIAGKARRRVHEWAEERNFEHISTGEDDASVLKNMVIRKTACADVSAEGNSGEAEEGEGRDEGNVDTDVITTEPSSFHAIAEVLEPSSGQGGTLPSLSESARGDTGQRTAQEHDSLADDAEGMQNTAETGHTKSEEASDEDGFGMVLAESGTSDSDTTESDTTENSADDEAGGGNKPRARATRGRGGSRAKAKPKKKKKATGPWSGKGMESDLQSAAAKKGPSGQSLEEAMKELKLKPGKCPKCKQMVGASGIVCKYCKEKYCIRHGLPEVHGCGADAKRDARDKWLKTCSSATGGTALHSKAKVDRTVLKSQLKKKIDGAGSTRRATTEGGSSGKPSSPSRGKPKSRGRGRGRGKGK